MFDVENQVSLYATFATAFLGLYAWLLARDRSQRHDEPPYYPYLIPGIYICFRGPLRFHVNPPSPGLGHVFRYADNQRFYLNARFVSSLRYIQSAAVLTLGIDGTSLHGSHIAFAFQATKHML